MRIEPERAITRRGFAERLSTITASLVGLATARVLPAVASPARPAGHQQSRLDDLRARLPVLAEYAAEAIPGFAVATISDGKVAWTGGFGLKKAGTRDAVTEDTVFEAASLSKPVFAYAVLRLREQGVIDIDRPLLQYMPFPDIGDDSRAALVTARHVMSHRTGLPNWRAQTGLAFEFTPGERYGYSGEAVVWLQRVVEHLTATPFSQHMDEHVLQPFGMRRSSFLLRPDMNDNISLSHVYRGQSRNGIYHDQGLQYLELAQRWNKPLPTWTYEDAVRATRELDPKSPPIPSPTNWSPNAAGGLLTTAGDYARFMMRTMTRPSRDQHDLTETSRQEMLTPATRFKPALSYGLGWALEDVAGAQSFWHGGWNRGFKAFALGDIKGTTGIVLLTNSTEGDRLFWPIVNGFTGRGSAALLS